MTVAAAGSPRTADAPMALSKEEVLVGAAYAVTFHGVLTFVAEFFVFTLLFIPALSHAEPHDALPSFVSLAGIGFIYGGIAALVAFLFAVAVSVPGLLLAHLLARLMRRITSRRTHLVVWTLVGVVIAAATGGLLGLLMPSLAPPSPIGIAALAPAAIAVPLSWWWVSTNALRADRGLPPRRALRCFRAAPPVTA